MKSGRLWLVAICVTCLWGLPSPASGRPDDPDDSKSLRDRIGFSGAERLLHSESRHERLRGLERLGAVGTSRALRALVRALEPGGSARSAAERLSAVRALAPHAHRPSVQHALVQAMNGVGAPEASLSSPLARWVEASAALALARSNRPRAWSALGKALGSVGVGAQAAREALASYPPERLDPLVEDVAPTIPLVEALESLADQRAFRPLRSIVKQAAVPVRARAALALTRLGAYETIDLARHWHSRSSSPKLHTAAAEILALGHAPDAPAAIARLLSGQSTRRAGIDLALAYPHPALVDPLHQILDSVANEDAARVIAAIGRAASPRATAIVAGLLERGNAHAFPAAYALARSPGADARRALQQALDRGRSRRLAVRAAAIRLAVLDDEPAGFATAIDRLRGSKEPADRAAAAFALAVREPHRLDTLIASGDPVVVRAAARQLVVAPASTQMIAARLISQTSDRVTRAALALALGSRSAAARVPSHELSRLIDQSPAAAPLAARALAARARPTDEARVIELFEATDPRMRAHVALGLGHNESPQAVGLLADHYRFEPDARVRQAIVVALGRQENPGGHRILELAARLDADLGVREAARSALDVRPLTPSLGGRSTLWVRLEPSRAGDDRPLATVADASGLALPLVPDPDGVTTVVGLAAGPVDVRPVVYD